MRERRGASHLTMVDAALSAAQSSTRSSTRSSTPPSTSSWPRAPLPTPAQAGPEQAPGVVRSMARQEWLVLVVVWLWCFALAVRFELSAVLLSWTSRHESSALDDLVLVAAVALLSLLLTVWQRHRRGLGGGDVVVPGQAELDLTAEPYRPLFEYHPSAVFSLDFGGGFTSTNAACEQLTGYPAAQLREMTFYDLLWRGDVLEAEAGFVRALDRHPQQLELS